jgi:1,2-diacylglycerol 3-alpha-glucosyltransferase
MMSRQQTTMTATPAVSADGSGMMVSKRLTILFHRLGPYHAARLQAAAETLALTAVEFSDVDLTYRWDPVTGQKGFERILLFQGEAEESQPARRVAGAVDRALNKLRPGAVAIPGWSDRCALAALDWCVNHDCPAIVMSDSTAADEPRKPWREFVKKRLVTLYSAGFVAGSRHVDYLCQLGLPRERIFTGYDVVDNNYFEHAAADARRSNHSGSGRPRDYFLASARFVEKKNLRLLLRAHALYRQKALARNPARRPWDLVLLGDGPLDAELRQLVSDLKTTAFVHLPGFMQYAELPGWYASAGAFILASVVDQWGLVVNEAMASGLPVLVSDHCGCADDLVRDGVNGHTFNPLDEGRLAELMLGLAGDAARLADMGAASRKIIQSWGLDRFVDGLKRAVTAGLTHRARRPTASDRLLLRALIHR